MSQYDTTIRIARHLARVGLCSKRTAEKWIAQGRVSIDDTVITTPACKITPQSRIMLDGHPIPQPQPTRLWRYHKPNGLVTTTRDEKGDPPSSSDFLRTYHVSSR